MCSYAPSKLDIQSHQTKSAMSLLSRKPSDVKNLASIMRPAYELLEFLMRSDRPQLALGFAVEVIVGQPDATSWHRPILTVSFARDMGAYYSSKPHRFLHVIDSRLVEKSGQKIPSVDHRSEGLTPSSSSRIKVTTVKNARRIYQISFRHALLLRVLSQ